MRVRVRVYVHQMCTAGPSVHVHVRCSFARASGVRCSFAVRSQLQPRVIDLRLHSNPPLSARTRLPDLLPHDRVSDKCADAQSERVRKRRMGGLYGSLGSLGVGFLNACAVYTSCFFLRE